MTRGALSLFDDPAEANLVGLRAERIEVRAYFTFKAGAFAQDGWKETPRLDAIRVRYVKPTTVRRRTEVLE